MYIVLLYIVTNNINMYIYSNPIKDPKIMETKYIYYRNLIMETIYTL